MFINSFIYSDNLAVSKNTESIVIDAIENSFATDAKHCSAKTNSDSDVEFETNEEAWQDVCENMYTQWLRVCDENHHLVSKNAFLIDLKDKSEKN